MKIALAQINIIWEDEKANLLRAEEWINKATLSGADMIFFPEMSFTGFSVKTLANAATDDSTLNKIKDYATKYKIAIGFGIAVRDGDKARNRYIVVSDEGEVISCYDKINLFLRGLEHKNFIPGDKVIAFDYKGVRIATFICFDLRFPEIFRSLKEAYNEEIDALILPANWPGEREMHWTALLQARAIENQMYILGVNCVGDIGGTYYSGCTQAFDPYGNPIEHIKGEEGLLLVDIDDMAKDARKNFCLRR